METERAPAEAFMESPHTLKMKPFLILFCTVSYSAIKPHMMAYLWRDDNTFNLNGQTLLRSLVKLDNIKI